MDSRSKRSLGIYIGDLAHGKRLSDEEEKRLASLISAGDKEATDKLVASNLRYVVRLAGEYKGKGLSIEDLICEGNIGMIKASGKFRPECGKRFAAFAAPYIRQAMEQAIGQQNSLYQLPQNSRSAADINRSRLISSDAPLGGRQNVTILGLVADDGVGAADDFLAGEDMREEIEKAIKVLDERQETVIRAFYGIGRPNATLAEIAQEMEIGRERARQIRDKAVRHLIKGNRRLKAMLRK